MSHNPFRKVFGGHKGGTEDYAPPSGPPPGKQDSYAPPSGPPPGREQHDYAPPTGPPPGKVREDYYESPAGPPPGRGEPPPGAPPSHQMNYAPPSGPPPTYGSEKYQSPPGPPPEKHSQDFAAPPGPPPSKQRADDWIAPPPEAPPSQGQGHAEAWETAVPDTSLFPPPPAIFSGHYVSPSSNATEDEAQAGQEWCERYPLTQPMTLDQPGRAALDSGNIRLIEPAGFRGSLKWMSPGLWEASSAKKSPDRCIIGYPPLYVASEHDPTRSGQAKTIYYEVKIRRDSPTNFAALGFTALPYPAFRMPGWHRGSLAVHGDDGHRYVNDMYGGKEFTQEFRKGETLGIGMTFRPDPSGGARPAVQVFLTRDGRRADEWDIHEEIDLEQDGPVVGLEGFHDLSCAIGTYDGVAVEVVFDRQKWLYRDL